ncbi:MAG: efflux RND transporter periplasmic adaptor subunit [Bacteroidales bacterium]|nr:efflux RND transporter periplasmic adaptor subunit [Bacteroidales bacterium]
MKQKTLWTIIGIIAAAVILWLVFRPTGRESVSLETAEVLKIDISSSVTATGTVEPVTKVEVGTQVSGIISKLYVDYNDAVKAGQVIAEMDKVNLQAELSAANAQLATAKTEFEYQEKEYNRMKTLHDKELVSDSEFDQAQYQYQSARNAYSQTQASYTKVKRNLSYATITSPIDGVVISKSVEEGQTVAAGFSTPTLFTIAKDLTDMQVIANVDEADIGQVKEGQRVTYTVAAYPDDVFEGRVRQVRLEATTTSNVVTYEVVINAPNPDLKVKPGLTATITIFTLEEDDVLSVPTKALRFNPDPEIMREIGITIGGEPARSESTKTVWVKRSGSIVPVQVAPGNTSGDRTGISGDLKEGDVVVTGLSAQTPKKQETVERSPFAPGPRGGGGNNRNGSSQKK